MNALAYVLGGAILPLIIVLPVLALVRPRKSLEACCLIASLLLLVFAMEVRGGVNLNGMMLAEGAVAFSLCFAVYYVAKKVIRAVINNGVEEAAGIEDNSINEGQAKKRQTIVLLGSGFVALLGTIVSVTNLMGGSGKGSIFQPSNIEEEQRQKIVEVQSTSTCYILINNKKVVKISGELDGYVTTQYDKDGFNAIVYFKNGTSEKEVREYWWAHKQEILNICGFVVNQ